MTTNKKKSNVYEFFEEKNDTFKCKQTKNDKNCDADIPKLKSGSTASNLKRHLTRHHPEKAKLAEEKDDADKSKKRKLDESQKTINSFMPATKKACLYISKEDFKLGMIQLIAYDGVPLTFFQGKGFKQLNGQIANDLEINLGRQAVRAMILEKAKGERELLKKKLANALVFLKFDAATRLRNNFLGINVQFYDKENGCGLTVNTLALMDTDARHDAVHTKDLVNSTMNKFGMKKSDVLACVVDNATNMTKTIRLMNEELTEVEQEEEEEEEDEEGESECDALEGNKHAGAN